jgi:hypothetical protein
MPLRWDSLLHQIVASGIIGFGDQNAANLAKLSDQVIAASGRSALSSAKRIDNAGFWPSG